MEEPVNSASGSDFRFSRRMDGENGRVDYKKFLKTVLALGGVAQWIECWTKKQRVASLIPSMGTGLGCRPGPQEGALNRQPYNDVSLPFFFLPFPFL